MAALTCLRSVETNLKLTCPSPKSFVCNLPDSGRHVTSVFQGLYLSRSVGRVGENPGNEVDDLILCREVLNLNPSTTKKGSTQRSTIWDKVATTLNNCSCLAFNVDKRSVRDHVGILQNRHKKKLRAEEKALCCIANCAIPANKFWRHS